MPAWFTNRTGRRFWPSGSRNCSAGPKRRAWLAAVCPWCSTYSARTTGQSRSPVTCAASGLRPITKSEKISAAAIPNTPGRKTRSRRSRLHAANNLERFIVRVAAPIKSRDIAGDKCWGCLRSSRRLPTSPQRSGLASRGVVLRTPIPAALNCKLPIEPSPGCSSDFVRPHAIRQNRDTIAPIDAVSSIDSFYLIYSLRELCLGALSRRCLFGRWSSRTR